jgi:hypothetical protein
MSGAWLLLWLARLPCMPVELGTIPVSAPELPPVVDVLLAPPLPPLPAPLAMVELARYRIGFGPLSSVGEIRVSINDDLAEGSDRLVRVGGYGQGSIFGLGRMEKRVDSEFSPALLGSRRWTSARWKGGEAVTDTADQPRPGLVDLVRQRQGQPAERQQATFPFPAVDPIGFIMRVRVAPPAVGQSQTQQVLDGQALWRITLTTAGVQELPDSASRIPALRIEGRADPIFYDGNPDEGDRPHRTFVLWLSADPAHVPLRLSMPIGIADVVVELVEIKRRAR